MKAKRSKTSVTFVTRGLITKACSSYILTRNILRLEKKDFSVTSVIKVRLFQFMTCMESCLMIYFKHVNKLKRHTTNKGLQFRTKEKF